MPNEMYTNKCKVDICTSNIKVFLFADDAKMSCHIKDIVDTDRSDRVLWHHAL